MTRSAVPRSTTTPSIGVSRRLPIRRLPIFAAAVFTLVVTVACEGAMPPVDAGIVEPEPDPVPEAPVHLNIRFDYRFDNANFFRSERRAVLEEAAKAWGRLLEDDFPSIPAGTPLLTRNPSIPSEPALRVTSDEDIDDILIFVATAEIDGLGGATARSFPTATLSVDDDTLAAELTERYDGIDFAPWSGWIAFDANEFWYADEDVTNAGDIPAQGTDLYTNAMHEIGHILGVGTSLAFDSLVDADGAFAGDLATEAFGGPVPLSGNATHIDDTVRFEEERVLMDVSDPAGSRVPPSALDLAILGDIGYTLVP